MPSTQWVWGPEHWEAAKTSVERIANSKHIDARGINDPDSAGPSWVQVRVAERLLAKLEQGYGAGVRITQAQLDLLHDSLDTKNPMENELDIILREARRVADARMPKPERLTHAEMVLDQIRAGEHPEVMA